MIAAEQFVEAARERGFDWYAGVPCSFLTPFINYIINDTTLSYVSSANEGDAVASAAGATIGGKRAIVMLQNSGLGNAVNPLTSLAYIFRVPMLIICTHRGAPGVADEPQHELMGRITGDLFETMEIPWEYFPTQAQDIAAVLARADDFLQRASRPYALIMRKDTVAPHALREQSKRTQRTDCELRSFDDKPNRLSRSTVLAGVIEQTAGGDHVIIATTGFTGRELYALEDRPSQLYMVGSMGCASSVGLGLSMARPDLTVTVIDGDGAALMRMGNFATLGAYGAGNLVHMLLDNEAHDSTGAQATVSGGLNFAKVAAACGYAFAYYGNDVELIATLFHQQAATGPRFGQLKITTGAMEPLQRPSITPAEVCARLRNHIGASAT